MAVNERYLALDVFRGMTICFMIIVNTPGSWGHVYGPLLHADWHGFTPTDLVFPSFLFAVGNAMAFIMRKYESQGERAFWNKTLKRTLIIFGIGFLLHWFPFFREAEGGGLELRSLANIRILGVLQRIALCYFIAAVVLHYGTRNFVLAFSAVALFGYWLVSYVFGDPADPYSLTGNAGLRLDLFLMGPNHLYKGEGIPFDPEGWLSTIPAAINVIGGYFAGDFIRRHGNSYETVARLMIWGGVLIVAAFTWDMAFPINKKIWTSSYVLLTIGIDVMILAFLIYIIELYHKQRWTYFFVVFGRNPLFIFILSGILVRTVFRIPVGERSLQGWFYHEFFGSFAGPVFASFLFALFFMMLNWLVGYFLDRKSIYIKV